MSQILHIETESGQQINEDLAGKRFKNFIILEFSEDIIPHSTFLSEEEINSLIPDFDLDHESTITLRDPNILIGCFIKIKNFLSLNKNNLPVSHWIQETTLSWRGTSENFKFNGQNCYLEGLHNLPEKRDYIKLTWTVFENNAWIEYFDWIVSKPVINIGDSTFKIRTEDWYEEFSPTLDILISFCQESINNDERLYWTVS